MGVVTTYQLVAELDGRVLVAGLVPLGAAAVDADPPKAGPALRPAAAVARRLDAGRRNLHARRGGPGGGGRRHRSREARDDGCRRRGRLRRDGNRRRGWSHGRDGERLLASS